MFNRAFSLIALTIALTACSTTAPDSRSDFEQRREIDSDITHTLVSLYSQAKGSHELIAKAKGVLVFPTVLTAGFVIGGEYGEGALRIGSRHGGYYKITTGSIGLQAGAQSKSMIMVFMTQESLDRFVKSEGWTVGLDANVALFNVGADGSISTETARAPVIGFIMTNGGLMFNVSLQGTKITKLDI